MDGGAVFKLFVAQQPTLPFSVEQGISVAAIHESKHQMRQTVRRGAAVQKAP